jgi:hypothetical protein
MTRRLIALAFVATAVISPALAQSNPDGAACRLGSAPMARTELIFGTARQPSRPVTSSEWKRFVDREIASRFPDGFTVLDGQGGWRGKRGPTRETSHVLIVWSRPSPEREESLEALRSLYKQRFHQESVARIDGADCVSF